MIKFGRIYNVDEQGWKIWLIVYSPDDIWERVEYANNYSGINLVSLIFLPPF